VEKQTAHFYSVDITEKQAKMGLVCRVHSNDKSKFKVRNQMFFFHLSALFKYISCGPGVPTSYVLLL
jgi:hypothetical protein